MKDLAITLAPTTGAWAGLTATLGRAGVNLEGGGLFVHPPGATAHYLVSDPDAVLAGRALSGSATSGLEVVVREVVMMRLDQGSPGELARTAQALAAEGTAVLAQYSDHAGRLVLVLG